MSYFEKMMKRSLEQSKLNNYNQDNLKVLSKEDYEKILNKVCEYYPIIQEEYDDMFDRMANFIKNKYNEFKPFKWKSSIKTIDTIDDAILDVDKDSKESWDYFNSLQGSTYANFHNFAESYQTTTKIDYKSTKKWYELNLHTVKTDYLKNMPLDEVYDVVYFEIAKEFIVEAKKYTVSIQKINDNQYKLSCHYVKEDDEELYEVLEEENYEDFVLTFEELVEIFGAKEKEITYTEPSNNYLC